MAAWVRIDSGALVFDRFQKCRVGVVFWGHIPTRPQGSTDLRACCLGRCSALRGLKPRHPPLRADRL